MTTTTNTPHINELRASLMETLRHLGSLGRDGKPMDLDQAKAHVSVATAMKGIADTLVDSARVEVDYIKTTGQDSAGFLAAAPGLHRIGNAPSAHNPFPVSVRHVTD